ncbi:MAG TPA: TraR/DksA family transcriptional regulator [Desulfomonilia bacterium]
MLKPKDLQEIKELLLTMKKELLEDLEERIKSSDVSEQRVIGDIFDDADLEQSREFNLLLNTREKQKIKQIEQALLKLENGEYGICENCEEDIPVGRLKAMPFASLCVKCKSLQETIEGHATVFPTEKG